MKTPRIGQLGEPVAEQTQLGWTRSSHNVVNWKVYQGRS